ncbi:MAG: hypothetical protein ABI586_08740 [Candidatus Nanopelagicales bacterium]
MTDPPGPAASAEDPLQHRAHHLAGAIYGTILATAVVATAGYNPDKVNKTVVIVAVTSAVFWLAHVYSLAVASRIVAKRPLTRSEVRSIAVAEWPMLQSCWPILASLFLGVLGVISREAAIDLAMIVGIAALFTYGLIIGRQERLGWRRIAVNASVTATFGVAILVMKVLVH